MKCCQNEDVEKKLGRRSGFAEGVIDQDNLRFSERRSSLHVFDEDLYSDFSEEYTDDSLETDWEHYGQDVTFDRKGKAKPMFNKIVLEKVCKKCSFKVQKILEIKGGFKIK